MLSARLRVSAASARLRVPATAAAAAAAARACGVRASATLALARATTLRGSVLSSLRREALVVRAVIGVATRRVATSMRSCAPDDGSAASPSTPAAGAAGAGGTAPGSSTKQEYPLRVYHNRNTRQLQVTSLLSVIGFTLTIPGYIVINRPLLALANLMVFGALLSYQRAYFRGVRPVLSIRMLADNEVEITTVSVIGQLRTIIVDPASLSVDLQQLSLLSLPPPAKLTPELVRKQAVYVYVEGESTAFLVHAFSKDMQRDVLVRLLTTRDRPDRLGGGGAVAGASEVAAE